MRIKWKTFIHGVTTAIVALMVMGIIAFPASAEQSEETSIQASASIQTFKNQWTGKYMGSNPLIRNNMEQSAINPNMFVNIKPASINSPEKWRVEHWRDGTVELRHYSINYALDDSAHGFRFYPRNKSQYQSWWVVRHSDGTISFRNQKTGRCIDDTTQYGLRTAPCNYLAYQRFY